MKVLQWEVDSGVQFLSEQLPDVAQQILLYKMAQSCCIALICFLLLAVLNIWFINKHRKDKNFFRDDWGDVTDEGVFSWCVVIVANVILGLLFISYASQALQIYIAPKIFLIEYSAQLFK